MESLDWLFREFGDLLPEFQDGRRFRQQVEDLATLLDQLAQEVENGTIPVAEAVQALLKQEIPTPTRGFLLVGSEETAFGKLLGQEIPTATQHIWYDLAIETEAAGMIHRDPRRALRRFTLLYEIGQEKGDTNFLACQCGNLGATTAILGQHSEALAWFEQAVRYAEQVGYWQTVSSATAGMAQEHAALGNVGHAMELYHHALAWARQVDDGGITEAKILGQMGVLWVESSPWEAVGYFERALGLFSSVNHQVGVASTLLNLGYAHFKLRDFARAVDYSGQAVFLLQQTGSRGELCTALGNLARAYSEQGRHNDATRWGEQGVALARLFASPEGLADQRRNLAAIYEAAGNTPKAQQCLQGFPSLREVVESCEGDNPPRDLVSDFYNAGDTCWRLGKTKEALYYYEHAAALCRQLADSQRLQTLLSQIGTGYSLLRDHDKALRAWQEELKLARRDGKPVDVIHALSMVSQGYRNKGQAGKQRRCYDEMVRIYRGLVDQPLKEMWPIALDMWHRAFDHGDLDMQSGCWERYLRMCEVRDDVGGIAEARSQITQTYELAGKVGEALKHYEKILELGEARGEPFIKMAALTGMANLWHRMADHRRMLESCERAYGEVTREIERRRDRPDFPAPYDVKVQLCAAIIFDQKAYAHRITGEQEEINGNRDEAGQQYDQSLNLLSQALEIVQREPDDRVVAALGAKGKQIYRPHVKISICYINAMVV
jgi:tetratricopeptide (TPR) repeat protein